MPTTEPSLRQFTSLKNTHNPTTMIFDLPKYTMKVAGTTYVARARLEPSNYREQTEIYSTTDADKAYAVLKALNT